MVTPMSPAATPSLAAYRSQHRIQVDDSGPLPVCAVDHIRIHPTRVGGWIHDQATTDRLHRADVRAMVRDLEVHNFGCPERAGVGDCDEWESRKSMIDSAILSDPERP